ncbi:hypothetical protein LWI28_017515 [Acer negundo]|uniref:dCTP pyrophosphatase 1 n=1 Tax=Acer negundo TaxID=4023 RepID=A0AAD5JTA7_ACENE|nr:hypothetical protein LWI28_017515 [Acer negundo]
MNNNLKITKAETAVTAAVCDDERNIIACIREFRESQYKFIKTINDLFHTPRNLLLALVGEVGELSEIFQWKGDVPRGLPGWKEEEKQHVGEELSDVLLYLVRLSDICGVNLDQAVLRKLELNAIKYPAPLKPQQDQGNTHQ